MSTTRTPTTDACERRARRRSGRRAASVAFALALACSGLAAPLRARPLQHAAAPPTRELLVELTASARLAGTSGSAFGAEVVARALERAGFEVEVDERVVLLSLPRRIELELYEDDFAERAFVERVHAFDPDAIPAGDVPPFNAWAKSGDVRGAVVDAGHGLADDYARLARQGVDVAGCIVLARYGHAYRGVKVEEAERRGAIGVLLFSEPSAGEAAWPAGPAKPDWEAERGSISRLVESPGDPSTPGWPSPAPADAERVAARRLAGAELERALPGIPCIPIGARDALALQARLATRREAGAGADDPRDVPVGPGPVEARIVLDAPRDLRTIRNVIGTLPGKGDALVLAGSHRDAWVRGAHDAGSGCVALLRAAQHLAAKTRDGWVPEASIALAFWDAEELGLIGSTEYGEAHAERLRAELVAYVNADAAVGGTRLRRAGGTPGLLGALRRALERVPSAAADGTLWDELVAGAAERGGEPELGLPGSGSDFTVFLHHLGLPVLDLALEGSSGGHYHTAFDDLAQVERHIDPGFVGHELFAQLAFELLVELAERPADAFDAREAARALAAVVREAGGTETASVAWLGAERAERLARAFERVAADVDPATPLYARLAAPDGLAGRPWFKNRLWAPGLSTGYAAETLPGLRRAAERGEAELEQALVELERDVLALVAASAGAALDAEPGSAPLPPPASAAGTDAD